MYKLVLEDFLEETNFTLIGIHTSLEDYRIAFLLNQTLQLKLQRKAKDFSLHKTVKFPVFEWQDKKQQKIWNLVPNKITQNSVENKNKNYLFSETTTTNYILPEIKKVNYILKISEVLPVLEEKKVLDNLLQIKQIITAYTIALQTVKNKENIIFN